MGPPNNVEVLELNFTSIEYGPQIESVVLEMKSFGYVTATIKSPWPV